MFLVLANSISSQKYRILSVTKQVDHSKDFRITGYCYDKIRLVGDTLTVQFYTQNAENQTKGMKDAFTFRNGVLNFFEVYTETVKDSIYFNPKTKKNEIIHMGTATISMDALNPDQKRTYKLVGFKTIPKVIQYNQASLCKCPTKPLKSEIYKNEKINVINANGLKDGRWIEFYDTGQIMKTKKYDNGNLLGGYWYDKKGKKTHRIQESAMETAIPIE